jgi:hypothetical protein
MRQGPEGFSSFLAMPLLSLKKNRSEAKPGMARSGAQIKRGI